MISDFKNLTCSHNSSQKSSPQLIIQHLATVLNRSGHSHQQKLTTLWRSIIRRTRVGPSVSTLTESIPEPGRSRCLDMACSSGTPFSSCGGPNTTSFPSKRDKLRDRMTKLQTELVANKNTDNEDSIIISILLQTTIVPVLG